MLGVNPILIVIGISVFMYLSINGYEHGFTGIKCGVPQGSFLGTSTFNIYYIYICIYLYRER